MNTETSSQTINLNSSTVAVEHSQLVPYSAPEAAHEQPTATEVFETMQAFAAETATEGGDVSTIFPEKIVEDERYTLGRFITTDKDGEVIHTLYTITSTNNPGTCFGVQRSNGEDMFLTGADLGTNLLEETDEKREGAIEVGARLLTDYANAPDAPVNNDLVIKVDKTLAKRRLNAGRVIVWGAVVAGGAIGALAGQLVADATAHSRAEHAAVAEHKLEKTEHDVTAAIQRGATQHDIDDLRLDVKNAKAEVFSAGDSLRYPLLGMGILGILGGIAATPASIRMERTGTPKKKA